MTKLLNLPICLSSREDPPKSAKAYAPTSPPQAGQDSSEGVEPSMTQSILFTIPPEIRIHIYKYLFSLQKSIDISIGWDGYFVRHPNCRVNVPINFLLTCRQACDEAQAYIYLPNTFKISALDTRFLAPREPCPPQWLQGTLPTRMLMRKVTFIGSRHLCHFAHIATAFPRLNEIRLVFPADKGPATFLLAIYELARAIANSPVRRWPRLEVHIRIPSLKEAVNAQKTAVDTNTNFHLDPEPSSLFRFNECDRVRQKLFTNGKSQQPRPFRFEDFGELGQIKAIAKMGQEIPDTVALISVHGTLLAQHAEAIAKYRCSYGDCSFERVTQEPISDQGYRKEVYVWNRDGDLSSARSIMGQDPAMIARLMHQFVPTLDKHFTDAIIRAGIGEWEDSEDD